MSASALFEMRGISYRRNNRAILDGIDWKVEAGEDWALFGPNGCGKSTLLRILLGYELPNGGELFRFGEELPDLRELRKDMGYVGAFIRDEMAKDETVLDAVASGRGASIGIFFETEASVYAEAREKLSLLGLSGYEGRTFGTLSEGEKNRVLIGRALMANPKLLILDEPSSHLDIAARERLLQNLEAVKAAHPQLSLLLVTHHPEEIPSFVSRVLMLRQGKTFFRGTPETAFTSKVLSGLFELPIESRQESGRYSIRLIR